MTWVGSLQRSIRTGLLFSSQMAFLRRASGAAIRRVMRWPIPYLLASTSQAFISATAFSRLEPEFGGARFIRGHLRAVCLQRFRRFFFRRTPSDAARAAFFLAQVLDMLQEAEVVLRHYRDVVFGIDKRLLSIELIDDVRNAVPADLRCPITLLKIAVAAAPNYAEAWCELGRQLLAANRPRDAIAAFRRVPVSASYADPERNPETLNLGPHAPQACNVKAYFYVGQAYEELGDDLAALNAYAEASVLQPNVPIVCRSIAALLLKRGHIMESLNYWNPAMFHRPFTVALPKVGRDLRTLPALIAERVSRIRSTKSGSLRGAT